MHKYTRKNELPYMLEDELSVIQNGEVQTVVLRNIF